MCDLGRFRLGKPIRPGLLLTRSFCPWDGLEEDDGLIKFGEWENECVRICVCVKETICV